MYNNRLFQRFFPFLAWFPLNSAIVRGDVLAGIIGALVLVPKAMAYAQLTGLPLYFGLYTAFIPAILGAMWGSSRQLSTGPVAIVSLMTAAALAPIAIPFTDEYIGLALLLTLMVGGIQLSLGLLKLGSIINFVSHPVILGFINAAAIIIGLSQLGLMLGIPQGRSDLFMLDIWTMLSYVPQAHMPTLAMAVFALILMLVMKKIAILSRPSVLIAVIITTIISAVAGYAYKTTASAEDIVDPVARELVSAYMIEQARINDAIEEAFTLTDKIKGMDEEEDYVTVAEVNFQIEMLIHQADILKKQNIERLADIQRYSIERPITSNDEPVKLYLSGHVPEKVESDGRHWRVKKIEDGKIILNGGGDVVGEIPSGLPSFRIPTLSFEAFLQLLSAAFVIALVAFMECISMAKALAAKTKQRLDPSQELIGQGIANVGGSFFQAYPATGSFTGSIINLQAGAKTGIAMVSNGLFVAITLLFLAPHLYYLPKATLGVIVLLAVFSLLSPGAIWHAWKANKADGLVAVVTFFVTLFSAPHLDRGILIGAGLALALYLYRSMKPRVATLGRYSDGTLRDIKVNPNIPTSEHIIAIRFDGQLYFANVPYFEDTILSAVADKPDAKYMLIVGDGINNLDATGEEVIRHLNQQLEGSEVTLVFSGLKKQVLDVMRNTGLFEEITQERIFATENLALNAIYSWLGEEGKDDLLCKVPPPRSSILTQIKEGGKDPIF